MLALILMWIAFAYLGINITGLFSPAYEQAPWSLGRLIDLLKHIGCRDRAGDCSTARLMRVMRANLLDELNKPYVVTARAKGYVEWALVLKYPVRLAIKSAHQHDRLVPAPVVLWQLDCCNSDESAEYRSLAVARADAARHVPFPAVSC